MDQKRTDYFKVGAKQYKEIRNEYKDGKLPSLLLHVCCGACSCFPLVYLIDLFDITIYFSNSNINTVEEFNKRLDALKQYVLMLNNKFNTNIKIIVDEYKHNEFLPLISPYKNEKEMGKRCEICIKERMNSLFLYALNNNYKYVSTTMTVSRNKNSNYINIVGDELSNIYNNKVIFFHTDFKKNNGQDIGVEISKKYNVYRQDYCGCEYSLINKSDKNYIKS